MSALTDVTVASSPGYRLYAAGLVAGTALMAVDKRVVPGAVSLVALIALNQYGKHLGDIAWNYLSNDKGQELHNRQTLSCAGVHGCLLSIGFQCMGSVRNLSAQSAGYKTLSVALFVLGGFMTAFTGYLMYNDLITLRDHAEKHCQDGKFFRTQFYEQCADDSFPADDGERVIREFPFFLQRLGELDRIEIAYETIMDLGGWGREDSIPADNLPLMLRCFDQKLKDHPRRPQRLARFVTDCWESFFLKGNCKLRTTYALSIRLSVLCYLCKEAATCPELKTALVDRKHHWTPQTRDEDQISSVLSKISD